MDGNSPLLKLISEALASYGICFDTVSEFDTHFPVCTPAASHNFDTSVYHATVSSSLFLQSMLSLMYIKQSSLCSCMETLLYSSLHASGLQAEHEMVMNSVKDDSGEL